MIMDLALLVIFAIAVGAAVRDGLWRGAILLLNVLAAATAATAWYERLAAFIEPYLGGFAALADIVSSWLIFVVAVVGMQALALWCTPTKVRFPKWVDLAGAVILALVTAWTVVEFAATTLHTVPLREGAAPSPQASFIYRLGPDRRWLGWVRGATNSGPFADAANAFDPGQDYIERYARKRGAAAPAR